MECQVVLPSSKNHPKQKSFIEDDTKRIVVRALCKCGCGKEVSKASNQYVVGHAMKGRKHSEEVRKKKLDSSLKNLSLARDKNYSKKILVQNSCACGCGDLTAPGCQYISGHNSRNISEEVRNKLRIASTGKTHTVSEEGKVRLRLLHTGKILSEEQKKRISEVNKGKIISEEHKERIREVNRNKQLTSETLIKMSQARIKFYQENPDKKLMGSKSNFFVDGRCCYDNYLGYTKDFSERLKELIRDRDNRECQLCFISEKEVGIKFPVHHIDYDKENCDPRNLITLCRSCHGKTSSNRDKWMRLFQDHLLTLIQTEVG